MQVILIFCLFAPLGVLNRKNHGSRDSLLIHRRGLEDMIMGNKPPESGSEGPSTKNKLPSEYFDTTAKMLMAHAREFVAWIIENKSMMANFLFTVGEQLPKDPYVKKMLVGFGKYLMPRPENDTSMVPGDTIHDLNELPGPGASKNEPPAASTEKLPSKYEIKRSKPDFQPLLRSFLTVLENEADFMDWLLANRTALESFMKRTSMAQMNKRDKPLSPNLVKLINPQVSNPEDIKRLQNVLAHSIIFGGASKYPVPIPAFTNWAMEQPSMDNPLALYNHSRRSL